uniref:Odorant receptor n=1 Tax=Heortia vitessoides TaxID=1557813 RepID=A0A978W721_9NEOP|nr:odorant receptor 21 [Heortia vitessoides]
MWEKIRKFGLGYCDLPTMMWNVSTLLRVITINIDSRQERKIPIYFYVLTLITYSGYLYIYLISMLWFVFWKSHETGDMTATMIVFSLGVSSEIGPCKMIYMMWNEELARKVVDGYIECDRAIIKGSRFFKNLLKGLRTVKKRALIFWIVIIGNGVIYILKPIITPGRHIMEDNFINLGLEPQFETPYYQIAFFLTSLGVYITCYLPANLTAFLIVLIGYTEVTLLALSRELLNLWGDAQEYYKKALHNRHSKEINIPSDIHEIDVYKQKIVNDYIQRRLYEIVRLHKTNIILINQIELVFRGAIAMEFILLIVGLLAILLGGLENTYIQMPFAMIQVSMDCLTGQRLIDACGIFENAVYDCKWENFNASNMKTVLLILQISQKTLNLSAGGCSKLSFTCLMTVIRSIYSAYTALRSTML